jgi:hypothetical protein
MLDPVAVWFVCACSTAVHVLSCSIAHASADNLQDVAVARFGCSDRKFHPRRDDAIRRAAASTLYTPNDEEMRDEAANYPLLVSEHVGGPGAAGVVEMFVFSYDLTRR